MKTLLLNLWAWVVLHPVEVVGALVSALGAMIAAATAMFEALEAHHSAALKARALMVRNEHEEAWRVLTDANAKSRAALAEARGEGEG